LFDFYSTQKHAVMPSFFKYFMTVLLCMVSIVSWAQFDKANDFFQKKEYAKAIPLYEQGLKEKESLLAKTRLAQCYQILNRMVQAESLFSEIVKEPKAKAISYKYYAESLMSNGKYPEAKTWFLEYFKLASEDSTALQLAAACDLVGQIQPYFAVRGSLPAPFNSDGDDNSAAFGSDGLIFTSDRTLDKALLKQKSGATGRDYLKIWMSQPKDSTWSEPEHYSSRVNDLNVNTANLSLSKDHKTLAFSRNNTVTSKKGEYKMHLFLAEVNDKGRIGKADKLDFCSDEMNYMHPTLSAEGNMMVFSSDSKGEGGMDLFVSYKRKDKWSVPRNLGAVINTPRHEAFPYLHHDGRLFFASKGHAGFGGFDIFVTTFDTINEQWTKPINLGRPINSPSDDLGFAFAPDSQAGTFSSTRGSGNDDVYFFWMTDQQPNWASYFKPEGSKIIEGDTATIPAQVVQIAGLAGMDDRKSEDTQSAMPELEGSMAALQAALVAMQETEIVALVKQVHEENARCPACALEVICTTLEQKESLAKWLGEVFPGLVFQLSQNQERASVRWLPDADGQ
jgi:tetratricopeptide (TPR) repeat protein